MENESQRSGYTKASCKECKKEFFARTYLDIGFKAPEVTGAYMPYVTQTVCDECLRGKMYGTNN